MLILMRRAQEEVLIGDDIRVIVLGVDRGHVKLGIEAPDNVRVDRKEIREKRNSPAWAP